MGNRINIAAILILCLVFDILIAEEPAIGKQKPASQAKTMIYDTGNFDGNRIHSDMQNNGMVVSHRVYGRSGLEWPKGNNTYAVFASGLWLAGMVDDEVRVACSQYSPERVPGPYGSNSKLPKHKLYKVSRSDYADPSANEDFQNWPVDLGAPWIDVDNDGIYDPLPRGSDHPDFFGDQVIWYVSNDGDTTGHTVFNTLPLGVEVQTTIFGFERPDAFGDIMFVKELIINKGGNTIEDMYAGIWSDPDLGDAGDDFVGCDTTLGMGICYNDGNDEDYLGYSDGTPAVGYDFFQGPMVPSPGDTAAAYGRKIPNFKNLSMTSFIGFKCGVGYGVCEANTGEEVYNLMQGLTNNGSEIPEEFTAGSKFMLPGDPTKNTGPDDNVIVDSDFYSSGDRYFTMNAGPFTMAPGDSQEVVYGIMLAAAGDPLDSYLYLKQVDEIAQLAFDSQFDVHTAPPEPEVTISSYDSEIILTWDDLAESYIDEDVIDKMPVPIDFDSTFATFYVDSTGLAEETRDYTILDT
ncbi:MAG: hypothetical protein V3U16_00835, partial [Candidatus Neomarinimicrobiota bacterium]